jgi:Calcineurin-like phosphoesterase
MAEITWLHISDLHAFSPIYSWDAGEVLETVSADLMELQGEFGLTPDLILFTGDAAFGKYEGHSMQSQFNEAFRIINKIRQLYNDEIPLSHCFFVPGNHDVDRSEVTPAVQLWLSHQLTVMPLVQMLEAEDGGLSSQREQCFARLASYRDFLRSHQLDHCGANSNALIYAAKLQIKGIDIGVAGFNSAFTCASEGEKGKLWMAAHWQVSKLMPTLDNCHLRIALVHHPDSWLNEVEGKLFQELSTQVDFLHYGHEHHQWVDSALQPKGRRKHVRIAAGSLYERSDKPNRNGYSIVKWNSQDQTATVYLREYSQQGRGWRARDIPRVTDRLGRWPPQSISLNLPIQETPKTPVTAVEPVPAPKRRQDTPIRLAVIGPLSGESKPFGLSHARGLVAALFHALDLVCNIRLFELDTNATESLSSYFTFEWIDSDQFQNTQYGLRTKMSELQALPVDGVTGFDAIFGPIHSGEVIDVFMNPVLRLKVPTILVSAGTTRIETHPDYGMTLLRPAPTLRNAAAHAAVFAYYYVSNDNGPCDRLIVLHRNTAYGEDTCQTIKRELENKQIFFQAIPYNVSPEDEFEALFSKAITDSVIHACEGFSCPLVFIADTGPTLAILVKSLSHSVGKCTIATLSSINSQLLQNNDLNGLYVLGTHWPNQFALNEPHFPRYIRAAQEYLSSQDQFADVKWLEPDNVDAEVHDGAVFWLDRMVLEGMPRFVPKLFKDLYVTNLRMVKGGENRRLRNATAMEVFKVVGRELQVVHVSRNSRERF